MTSCRVLCRNSNKIIDFPQMFRRQDVWNVRSRTVNTSEHIRSVCWWRAATPSWNLCFVWFNGVYWHKHAREERVREDKQSRASCSTAGTRNCVSEKKENLGHWNLNHFNQSPCDEEISLHVFCRWNKNVSTWLWGRHCSLWAWACSTSLTVFPVSENTLLRLLFTFTLHLKLNISLCFG